MKKRMKLSRPVLFAVGLAATVSLVTTTSATGATLSTIANSAGSAYGLKTSGALTAATLAAIPVNVPETPSVATTNSTLTSTRTVASAYVPLACAFFTPTCAVNGHALKVSTRNASGLTGSSVASSDLKDISLLFDLVNLKAVHADCRADGTGLTMNSSIVVGPAQPTLPVPVTLPPLAVPGPNTVVPIGSGTTVVGTITLNEQIDTGTTTRNSGEVNAVHIRLLPGSLLSATGLDIIVGHAACSASQT